MRSCTRELKETTCPYCGVGCGIDIGVEKVNAEYQLQDLQGTRNHPANYGRLCVKGQSLLETTQSEGRLLSPMIEGKDSNWDEASTWVANKISDAIKEHGKDSVAFYVSGQLLTEDYYVANKLMKGFIGSGNIDTNSRLCMSSAVSAYKRAFGEDLVPCCYDDIDKTDLLVLIGSNAAWTHPVLFQRMERAKLANPNLHVVQVDPRKTATSSLVDISLALKPGTDAILFNGLLRYIGENSLNLDYVKVYTDGYDAALLAAEEFSPSVVSQRCELALEDVIAFYELFSKANSALSFYSMGINQSSSGVDKANAIINCHLASGQIGKEGSGPFSITGQPNAMGGREVGGLANMLAAHMSFEEPKHLELLSQFWQSQNLATKPGLKAVDLFNALEQGKIKFLWIMGTNPVASMPNRSKVEAALKKCPTVVVSDVVQSNDTLKFAHAALPATPWSEKDGTVTNSERCISRQRAIVPAKGDAKHDWQIMCEVATKMGHGDAFSFSSPSQIFQEHARLSAFKNHGERAFNLSALCNLSEREYQHLKPVQWPLTQGLSGDVHGQKRLFTDGHFYTPNKRAQFIAINPRAPAQLTNEQFPFVLNTGRLRDQWHTMTRTGNAARLHQHSPEATLFMHPVDAKTLLLKEGDLVRVSSSSNPKGKLILPIQFDENLRRGSLFAPIHWTNQWASNSSVAWLFSSATDPISGQPELKHAAVNITKLAMHRYGVLASADKLSKETLKKISDYWTCTKQTNCYIYTIAIASPKADWLNTCKLHLCTDAAYYEYHQADASKQTCVAYVSEQLKSIVYLSDKKRDVASAWIDSLFEIKKPEISVQVSEILRFSPPLAFLQGKLVCSCHKVRELPITQAIESGINTLDTLGAHLKCGTNCGSCKSEISALIKSTTVPAPTNIAVSKKQQVNSKGSEQSLHLPITNLEASNL